MAKPKNPPARRLVCLEFSNTAAWHASPHPQERLLSYADFARWAESAAVVSRSEAGRLARLAAARPAEADRALRRAIELREAIYRILVASLDGDSPSPDDLTALNQTLRTMLQKARLERTSQGFHWMYPAAKDALDAPLGPIALSAAEVLVSGELSRVGQCADESGCGWLFLDTSKNRSRRWCDANDCGNRARQQRFQKRARRKAG